MQAGNNNTFVRLNFRNTNTISCYKLNIIIQCTKYLIKNKYEHKISKSISTVTIIVLIIFCTCITSSAVVNVIPHTIIFLSVMLTIKFHRHFSRQYTIVYFQIVYLIT